MRHTLRCKLTEHDFLLQVLKGCAAAPAGVSFCGPNYVVAAMANQPRILAWQRGKEQPVMRSVAPERLESLRCTADGSFILGGGQSGRLYAWEAGSGRLLAAFEAHYNAISCIATTDDDSYVITAGGDAIIHVWLLADILRSGTIVPKARQTW
jgi:pre-rRNA-processing protein IPI3